MSHDTIRVVAAVIANGVILNDDDRYLITQRRAKAKLPLLWEFPGGRVKDGETDEDALRRQIRYRLGVEVSVGVQISSVTHEYEHYKVELNLYDCKLEGGDPEKKNVNDFKWVTSDEFESFAFTPADETSMNALLGFDGIAKD